ncbi:MAG: hypothetical protein P8171_08570 [Candidatus Thiodiazotropha sp.]
MTQARNTPTFIGIPVYRWLFRPVLLKSGADIARHENPIRVINEQLTQDAATALMRADLPPATARQVKNVIEQLGDGIRADKVATGINGQFAENVGHLAHADPSSASASHTGRRSAARGMP